MRRCFLMGDDPVSEKNFDHRKQWIEDEVERSAANFGIDLIAFSLLSNHMHSVYGLQWSNPVETRVASRNDSSARRCDPFGIGCARALRTGGALRDHRLMAVIPSGYLRDCWSARIRDRAA